MMSEPSPQFVASLQAALNFWRQQEATGDIARLDRERQNLNRTIGFGLALPETRPAAIETTLGTFPLVHARGYWQEWLPVLAEAISVCPDDHMELKIELLGHYGQLLRFTGQQAASITALDEALNLAKQLGDPLLEGKAHVRLAHTYREVKRFEEVEAHCQAALDLLEPDGEESRPVIAVALNVLGRIERQRDNLPQALDYLGRAVAIWRQGQDELALAWGLHDLARALQRLQQYTEALACYEEAEQLLAGTELIEERIRLQADKGGLFFAQGDFVQAEKVFQTIDLPYLHQTGQVDREARVVTALGNTILYQGRFSEAAALLRQAIVLWQKLEDDVELANAVGSLGEALAGQGEVIEAKSCFQDALAILDEYKHLPKGQHLTTLFTNELNKLGGGGEPARS